MSKAIRILATSLLLFNGISAVFGGYQLMSDPSGNSIGLSIDYLKHSPFHNYLLPGIILMVANGFSSLFIAFLVMRQVKDYRWWIMIQGMILFFWLAVQIIMIRSINYYQLVFGMVGMFLLVLPFQRQHTRGNRESQFNNQL